MSEREHECVCVSIRTQSGPFLNLESKISDEHHMA